MEVGVLGVFVPERYCSIFCSKVGCAAFENEYWGDGDDIAGEVGEIERGESLSGEEMERLSTDRDQPLRAMLRRSPVPIEVDDGEALIAPTRSTLERVVERSKTDL